jgi:hypothetical protein
LETQTVVLILQEGFSIKITGMQRYQSDLSFKANKFLIKESVSKRTFSKCGCFVESMTQCNFRFNGAHLFSSPSILITCERTVDGQKRRTFKPFSNFAGSGKVIENGRSINLKSNRFFYSK